jgi:hypothetical protein
MRGKQVLSFISLGWILAKLSALKCILDKRRLNY